MSALVIFDMDGTLVDTSRATISAFSCCTSAFLMPMLSSVEISNAIGIAAPEFYQILYPSYSRAQLQPFANAVEQVESILIGQLGTQMIFDGVDTLLGNLHAAGVTLLLASTGSQSHVSVTMEATRLSACFTEIRCGEPDKTQMVAQLLEKYPHKKAVMIGDTKKDADAAHRNHITAIGAGFGYCNAVRAPLFDAVAMSPAQLQTMILNAQGDKMGF